MSVIDEFYAAAGGVRAWFAARSELPADASTSEHMFAVYQAGSGLSEGTFSDHEFAYWAARSGLTEGALSDHMAAFMRGSAPATAYYPSPVAGAVGAASTEEVAGVQLGFVFAVTDPTPLVGLRWYGAAGQLATPYLRSATTGGQLATGPSVSCGDGWNLLPLASAYLLEPGVDYLASVFHPGPSVTYTAKSGVWPATITPVTQADDGQNNHGRFQYGATATEQIAENGSGAWFGIDLVTEVSA